MKVQYQGTQARRELQQARVSAQVPCERSANATGPGAWLTPTPGGERIPPQVSSITEGKAAGQPGFLISGKQSLSHLPSTKPPSNHNTWWGCPRELASQVCL